MTAAHQLHVESSKAKVLAAALRAQGFLDDEDLIADTIEGETDALEAVSAVLRWKAEQDAMALALKTHEGDLVARRRRFEERSTGARVAIAAFMDQCGLTKLERPEATLSLRQGNQAVVRSPDFSADVLPDDLVRTKREPDAAAIKAALEAGREVPGAVLSNGAPVLTVRVR